MKINELKKCYKCKSTNLEHKKNFISLNGKTSEINVLECQKCGETYSAMDETEKVRKQLHPSIFNRISSFLSFKHKGLSMFRDRIL